MTTLSSQEEATLSHIARRQIIRRQRAKLETSPNIRIFLSTTYRERYQRTVSVRLCFKLDETSSESLRHVSEAVVLFVVHQVKLG